MLMLRHRGEKSKVVHVRIVILGGLHAVVMMNRNGWEFLLGLHAVVND